MINVGEVIGYLKKNARGRDNAICGADLGDVFGCLDPKIRTIVNELRRNGTPICSCRHGYYYSEDSDDIKATIDGLYARIENVLAAIDGLQGGTNSTGRGLTKAMSRNEYVLGSTPGCPTSH